MSFDLESRSACEDVAHMSLLPVDEHDLPIATFDVPNALGCALAIKRYITEVGPAAQPWLKIEHQELGDLTTTTTGQLYLLEGAARNDKVKHLPITIFALRVRADHRLRWFWTGKTPVLLLNSLVKDRLVGKCNTAEPHTAEHKKLYISLSMLFQRLFDVPQSPAFLQAESMTDYAPDIDDPDTAWTRVYAHEYIYHNAKDPMRDMSDDRYLLHLHESERYIASYTNISAASYLLLKRRYFRDFFRDLTLERERIVLGPKDEAEAMESIEDKKNTQHTDSIEPSSSPAEPKTKPKQQTPSRRAGRGRGRGNRRSTASRKDDAEEQEASDSPVDTAIASRTRGALSAGPHAKTEDDIDTSIAAIATPSRKKSRRQRVRTEAAHIEWIRRDQTWSLKRARLFIEGWSVLGFLDEWKFVDWIDAGGMFETLSVEK